MLRSACRFTVLALLLLTGSVSALDASTGRVIWKSYTITQEPRPRGRNTDGVQLWGPAGAGIGSVRRISAWDEISQIKDMSVSGGDQQFTDITAITDVVVRQAPTVRNAVTLNMTVMDDPTLAWYATVNAASETASLAAARLRFPNGSRLLANGYWSLQKTPNVAKNEAITTRVDVSYVAEATRYAT